MLSTFNDYLLSTNFSRWLSFCSVFLLLSDFWPNYLLFDDFVADFFHSANIIHPSFLSPLFVFYFWISFVML